MTSIADGNVLLETGKTEEPHDSNNCAVRLSPSQADPTGRKAPTPQTSPLASSRNIAELGPQFSVTRFPSLYGTEPEREFRNLTWTQVRNLIVPSNAIEVASKTASWVYVLGRFGEAPWVGQTAAAKRLVPDEPSPITGKQRSDSHVEAICAAVLDVDDKDGHRSAWDLFEVLRKAGLAATVHATWSGYTKQSNSGRILVPLDREMTAAEWRAAFPALVELCEGAIDPVSRSPSHAYFPHTRPRSPVLLRSAHEDGLALSADALVERGKELALRDVKTAIVPAGSRSGDPQLERDRAEAALMCLSADDYHVWAETVLCGLKRGLGDVGFDLWARWSATSDKCPRSAADVDMQRLRSKWDSFDVDTQRGGPVATLASVHRMAIDSAFEYVRAAGSQYLADREKLFKAMNYLHRWASPTGRSLLSRVELDLTCLRDWAEQLVHSLWETKLRSRLAIRDDPAEIERVTSALRTALGTLDNELYLFNGMLAFVYRTENPPQTFRASDRIVTTVRTMRTRVRLLVLTRFSGHFTVTLEGVKHGQTHTEIYAGVPAADGRAVSTRAVV